MDRKRQKQRKKIHHAPIVLAFAERLRELRRSRGMSQAELAAKAQIHVTYVGRLERGEAAPGLDLVGRLAEALSAPLSELLAMGATDPLPLLRAQTQKRVNSILRHAGAADLAMLNPWLALLDTRLVLS